VSRVTDVPHAAGPAAAGGTAGSDGEVGRSTAAPSHASAQSAWPGRTRQVAPRRVAERLTPTTLRYIGLAGSLGTALAGPRPIGLAAGLLTLAAVLARLWWRRRPAALALAATALLGPVFFPWYLLPALAALAATPMTRRTRDRLGLAVAVLALLVLPDGTGIAALTKPVGAFLDVVLVSAALVALVRRFRAGRARPTPTAR